MIDAYKVLGISRDADENAIKKAFRKLAKQYHPDTCKEPHAEEKFKEVNEAQRILNNSQEKMKHDIENGYVQQPGNNPQSGFPFGDAGIEDFFGEMFGNQNPFHQHRRRQQHRPTVTVGIELTLEEIYSGVTKLLSLNNRQLEVDIPPGCENGESFLIEIGDTQVNLQVHERRHPTVRREGLDLYKEIRVPLDMAVVGGEVRFEILGAVKTVNIPPETGSHKTIRVRGAGIVTSDNAGDLYLSVRIDINSSLVTKLRSRWA